jgi:DNA-binding CsgD family transcriptional regulator
MCLPKKNYKRKLVPHTKTDLPKPANMKSNLQTQVLSKESSVPVLSVVPPAGPTGYIRMLQRYQLSKRELQTLKFLSHGLTSYDIATVLNLSPETIDSHRKNIIRKLNASNIVQAVADGLRNKIIE